MFGFFGGSDFSGTVLHFRNIKLVERCSYFMYLYLYFSVLYEKVTEKSKNWRKDLTLNETKTKKKFKNKKRLGSFRLMFPKYNNTNISLFSIHIYHSPKLACFGICKMIRGNFKTIDSGYLVYKMPYGYILLS